MPWWKRFKNSILSLPLPFHLPQSLSRRFLRQQLQIRGTEMESPTDEVNFIQIVEIDQKNALKNSAEQKSIALCKTNLERIITETLNLQPEYKSLPIGIISVLGSDEKGLRQVYTDWLIHYYVNGQSNKAIEKWPVNKQGLACQSTLYVGKNGNFLQAQDEVQGSVYIWQKPYVVEEVKPDPINKVGVPKMLLWIIYATGKSSKVIDSFCASASSSIVTFKPSEKDELKEFIRKMIEIDGSAHAKFHVVSRAVSLPSNWSKDAATKAFKQLLEFIEKKPTEPKRHSAGVTLENFVVFLETVVEKVNHAYGNQRDDSPAPPIRSEELVTMSKIDVPQEVMDTIPPDTSLPNENSGPVPLPRMKIKTDVSPQEETLNEEEITLKIKWWIDQQLGITNVERMIDEIGVHTEDMIKLQQIIKSFNVDLRNMHDNYVCFHGDRDYNQMIRFRDAAFQRANQSWKINGPLTSSFSTSMLESVRDKLYDIYEHQNKEIITVEWKLITEALRKTQAAYECRMKDYIHKITGKNGENDLEAVHSRMVSHCVWLLGRSLDYGGKLNNLLREATKKLEKSLNELYGKLMGQLNILPEVEPRESSPSSSQGFQKRYMEAYVSEMQNLMAGQNVYEYSQWKQTHDIVIEKITRDLNGTDKEEFTIRADDHFLHMVEDKQSKAWSDMGTASTTNIIGLYITLEKTWVIAHTRQGNNIMTFRDPASTNSSKEVGFPSLVVLEKGRFSSECFRFGYEARLLMRDKMKMVKLENYGKLFDFISNAANTNGMTMIKNFVEHVKAAVENRLKEQFSQITLVLPSWFRFSERDLLWKCCKSAGIARIVMITESSLCAFHFFSTQPSLLGNKTLESPLFLVVIITPNGIKIEIFEKAKTIRKTPSLQLLAVTFERWLEHKNPEENSFLSNDHLNVVSATYGRAMRQLPKAKRKFVKYFTTIADDFKWTKSLDEYFSGSSINLSKVEIIQKEAFLNNMFIQFSDDPSTLDAFLAGLAGTLDVTSKDLEKALENELRERKEQLLETCKIMETQMEEGTVKVGKITKRIIMDAIEQAKLAAAENMFGGPEETELYELLERHQFHLRL